MIKFTVPLLPTAKGRPRFSKKGFAYTPAKTKQAERDFLAIAMDHRPEKPIAGPIQLLLRFSFPKPTKPKWKSEAARKLLVSPCKRPDLDNLVKLVKDALSGPFWVNDSQIVSMTAAKLYGDAPGTEVYISELPSVGSASEFRVWKEQQREQNEILWGAPMSPG